MVTAITLSFSINIFHYLFDFFQSLMASDEEVVFLVEKDYLFYRALLKYYRENHKQSDNSLERQVHLILGFLDEARDKLHPRSKQCTVTSFVNKSADRCTYQCLRKGVLIHDVYGRYPMPIPASGLLFVCEKHFTLHDCGLLVHPQRCNSQVLSRDSQLVCCVSGLHKSTTYSSYSGELTGYSSRCARESQVQDGFHALHGHMKLTRVTETSEKKRYTQFATHFSEFLLDLFKVHNHADGLKKICATTKIMTPRKTWRESSDIYHEKVLKRSTSLMKYINEDASFERDPDSPDDYWLMPSNEDIGYLVEGCWRILCVTDTLHPKPSHNDLLHCLLEGVCVENNIYHSPLDDTLHWFVGDTAQHGNVPPTWILLKKDRINVVETTKNCHSFRMLSVLLQRSNPKNTKKHYVMQRILCDRFRCAVGDPRKGTRLEDIDILLQHLFNHRILYSSNHST